MVFKIFSKTLSILLVESVLLIKFYKMTYICCVELDI